MIRSAYRTCKMSNRMQILNSFKRQKSGGYVVHSSLHLQVSN